MKKVIVTDKAPAPVGPYSQGIISGKRIYVAGQGPKDAVTGAMPEGVGEQTRKTLENVKAILEAGGATMDHVVKVTAHLKHLNEDFAAFNEVFKTFFKAPFPVRTTVGSDLLGILVEIDVIAEMD